MSCVTRLEKDLGFDCANKPIGGIERKFLLINREDIDWGGTTLTGNKITALVLKQGKTAFAIKGVKDSHFSASSKPVIDENGFNGFTHSIGFRIYGTDAETMAQIDALIQGAQLVAVVETKNRGTNGDNAFDVLGLNTGLEATGDSAGRDYFANDGSFLITLATPNGQKEPANALKWLETSYVQTKAKFDRNLAR